MGNPPLFTLGGQVNGLFDLLPQTQAAVALNKVRFLGAGPAEATFELLALVGLSLIDVSAGVWRFQKMHLKAA